MVLKYSLFVLIFFGLLTNCTDDEIASSIAKSKPWRFVVIADTHVTSNSDTIKEMVPYFIKDSIDLVVVCGDIVEGGLNTTSAQMTQELQMWEDIFNPLYDKGIGVYTMRGNHEYDVTNNLTAWNSMFSGSKQMPQNGPSGEENLTYSFEHNNAKFIILDNYVNIHKVNQAWLDQQLISNTQPHIFVFGHEAAFKVFHTDCLDDYLTERNAFWQSMENAGVKAYFCGHDHFFDACKIDNGNSNSNDDICQVLVGGGGGWIMTKYNYNGYNGSYTPTPKYHRNYHGYALVEVSGNTSNDLDVSITWKERYENQSNGSVQYVNTDYVINYSVTENSK